MNYSYIIMLILLIIVYLIISKISTLFKTEKQKQEEKREQIKQEIKEYKELEDYTSYLKPDKIKELINKNRTKASQSLMYDNLIDTKNSKSIAPNIVVQLKNAKGLINDDEEIVYNLLNSLKTKTSIAFISHLFYRVYNEPLLNFLLSFLNKDEFNIVLRIIKNKPTYV